MGFLTGSGGRGSRPGYGAAGYVQGMGIVWSGLRRCWPPWTRRWGSGGLVEWPPAVLAALDTSLGSGGLVEWPQAVLAALDTLLGIWGSC